MWSFRDSGERKEASENQSRPSSTGQVQTCSIDESDEQSEGPSITESFWGSRFWPMICCISGSDPFPLSRQCAAISGSFGSGAEFAMSGAEEVHLHVYDFLDSNLVRAANGVLMKTLGTGAFHVGVEVYGWEWSFGAADWGTGVFFCAPRSCEERCYRESVAVGYTDRSPEDVDNLIRRMEREWSGSDYDLVRRNCCHFATQLCHSLVVEPQLPTYISSMHSAGARVQDNVEHAGRMAEAAGMLFKASLNAESGGSVRL